VRPCRAVFVLIKPDAWPLLDCAIDHLKHCARARPRAASRRLINRVTSTLTVLAAGRHRSRKVDAHVLCIQRGRLFARLFECFYGAHDITPADLRQMRSLYTGVRYGLCSFAFPPGSRRMRRCRCCASSRAGFRPPRPTMRPGCAANFCAAR
jgi:hypothetical protein